MKTSIDKLKELGWTLKFDHTTSLSFTKKFDNIRVYISVKKNTGEISEIQTTTRRLEPELPFPKWVEFYKAIDEIKKLEVNNNEN